MKPRPTYGLKKKEVVTNGRRVVEYILRPGDHLPEGEFVSGWKLEGKSYGQGAICLHVDRTGLTDDQS